MVFYPDPLCLGVFPVALFFLWMVYKKTLLFKTGITILTAAVLVAFLSFLVGKYGVNHLFWYVPSVLLILFLGNRLIQLRIQKPIKKANQTLEKVSKGKIDFEINGQLHDSRDEIGTMKRALGDTIEYISNTAAFARKIGNNELEADHRLPGEEDQLGQSLLDMRNSLKQARQEEEERKKEDQKRRWITEGQAQFANILRQNNDDLEQLSYQIISNLVDYLGANQGGLFLLNEEDEEDFFYEMKAAYAFNRKKYMNKQIKPGEGLVGTCAMEKQTIYMTEIPQDYIRITSGLGDANPNSLLIVPLKVEEHVLGVIEMASFREFEPHHIHFVEKVAESIASTISSARTNIRTNQLLEKTRQQAEEMKAQEEEMRQNMEELHATNEESERRSEKMKEIASEVYEEEEKLRAFINKIKENN